MSNIEQNSECTLSVKDRMALMSVVGWSSSSDDECDDRESSKMEASQLAFKIVGSVFPAVDATEFREPNADKKTSVILAVPSSTRKVSSEQFLNMLYERVNYGKACVTEADQDDWIGLLGSLTPRQKFSHLVFVNSWLSTSKLTSTKVKKIVVGDGGHVVAMDLVDKDHELAFSMFQAQLSEGKAVKTALIPEVVFVLIEHFLLIFFNVGFNVKNFVDEEEGSALGVFWSRVVDYYVQCMRNTQQILNNRNMPISDVCYALRECIRKSVMDDNASVVNAASDWFGGFNAFESSVIKGINMEDYISKFDEERFGGVLDKVRAMATKSRETVNHCSGAQ